MLKVKDLLHAVGKKCGVDPYVIDHIDLENIVERAVAIREGREPPPDLNESPTPPKEPSPPTSTETSDKDEDSSDDDRPPTPPKTAPPIDFVIKRPVLQTISSNSASDFRMPTMDMGNFVAIDMELSDDFGNEQAFDWEEPLVIGRSDEQLIERDEMTSPEQLRVDTPMVLLDSARSDESTVIQVIEPRHFKEKKQKYGRDPKRLHATYQEEWDRLERLGTRLGPRRKSLLALQDVVVVATASTDVGISKLKKKGSSKNKKRSFKKRAAAPMKAAATAASADFQASDMAESTATNIPTNRTDDTVHRLSVTPLTAGGTTGRSRSPSNSSVNYMPDRRKSTTPRRLSPQLFKKFGDAIIKTEEEAAAATVRGATSSKRVTMAVSSGGAFSNKTMEAHVNLKPSLRKVRRHDPERGSEETEKPSKTTVFHEDETADGHNENKFANDELYRPNSDRHQDPSPTASNTESSSEGREALLKISEHSTEDDANCSEESGASKQK